MNKNIKSLIGKTVLKIMGTSLIASILITSVLTSYLVGFSKGYAKSLSEPNKQISMTIEVEETLVPIATNKPTIRPVPTKVPWGGPALWEAVNKRRVEFGVNPLTQRDELCTIASIRLNQLLELNKLDGHEGFSSLPDKRTDLKWIFDKYNISEFLVSGAESPQEAISLWEGTLGHKKLLSGGEYSYGCVYAQNGFGVAIAAY